MQRHLQMYSESLVEKVVASATELRITATITKQKIVSRPRQAFVPSIRCPPAPRSGAAVSKALAEDPEVSIQEVRNRL